MRLPVILNQQAPASGQSLAEDLVGELIGRPGLDLTLVDRFSLIRPDSSDQLTLDAITVPSAVLDWQSEDDIHAALQAVGFNGVRCAHELDAQAPAYTPGAGARRLFLFDLRKVGSAKQVLAELSRLRESLSVKTISLGGLSAGQRSTPEKPKAKQEVPKQVVPDAKPLSQPAPSSIAQPNKQGGDDLDDLIDQLDDMDV
ncbi:MAG: hypothetical protein AAFX06_17465 [Planctomycetota bacterium]